MELEQLKARLNEIAEISDHEWVKTLDERKLTELEFHNRRQDKKRIETSTGDVLNKPYPDNKFYTTTRKSARYCERWVALHSRDKVFLDYACGDGENAIKAAKAGASLSIGLDISDISLDNAREKAEASGLDNTFFLQADAENTNLPDRCIDTIVCAGILHHLDLSRAYPEMRRILAPGGKILAIEALCYNPLLKLYRWLTPDRRTEWEKSHILSLGDVKFASRFFDIGKVNYWYITSYIGAYLPQLLPVFETIDSVLTRIPGVRLMAWVFSFELLSKD